MHFHCLIQLLLDHDRTDLAPDDDQPAAVAAGRRHRLADAGAAGRTGPAGRVAGRALGARSGGGAAGAGGRLVAGGSCAMLRYRPHDPPRPCPRDDRHVRCPLRDVAQGYLVMLLGEGWPLYLDIMYHGNQPWLQNAWARSVLQWTKRHPPTAETQAAVVARLMPAWDSMADQPDWITSLGDLGCLDLAGYAAPTHLVLAWLFVTWRYLHRHRKALTEGATVRKAVDWGDWGRGQAAFAEWRRRDPQAYREVLTLLSPPPRPQHFVDWGWRWLLLSPRRNMLYFKAAGKT